MRSFWSYSPREGANCIGTTQEIKSEISTSYSPREGANCIGKCEVYPALDLRLLQSPWGRELHHSAGEREEVNRYVTVPVRARIASLARVAPITLMLSALQSPWGCELHHDIEVLKDLVKEGYSPREGANCIEKEFIIKMTLLLLQSPWGCELHPDKKTLMVAEDYVTVPVRVRIASAKGYNSCNKNQIILYNSQIHYTDKSFAFQ